MVGAMPSRLELTLHLNASTPDARPETSDKVRIFDPPPAPGAMASPDFYVNAATSVANPAARSVVLEVDWSKDDDFGRATVTVGVSSYDDRSESQIAGLATATRVAGPPRPPPHPAVADEADIFSSRPDAHGYSRHTVQAAAFAEELYHIFRCLDEVLLQMDRAQRAPDGTRGGAPANPAPLLQSDFDEITATAPAVASEMSNRALQALANLSRNDRAFEQVTRDPVRATGNTLTWEDRNLPAAGTNRYLYRLRSIAASGALGDFGWAYPPIRLWPSPPTRPTLAKVTIHGTLAQLRWSANSERAVRRYRVYATAQPELAVDERLMTLVVDGDVSDLAVADEPNRLRVSLDLTAGSRWWIRLVAVASYPAPVGLVQSAPSDAATVMPQTPFAPEPPAPVDVVVMRDIIAGSSVIRLTFSGNLDPTSRWMLYRRLAGSSDAAAISAWTAASPIVEPSALIVLPEPLATQPPALPALQLTDGDPLDAALAVEYVIAATNESGRVRRSEPIPGVN